MFTNTARFYDAIYAFKDYPREVARLKTLIGTERRTLLDVACGTGKHLELMKDDFRAEGLELDHNMATIARDRLPGVTIHQGDMACFSIGMTYDAVLCLFSSIGYVGSVERLNDAIECMARHLSPNGILIVEPWLRPEQYIVGSLHATHVDEENLKITRMNFSQRMGDLSVFDMHYLIGTPEGIEYVTERHRLYLFTHEQYREAFEKAGLEPRFEPDGLMQDRGLYIAERSA